MQTYFIIIFCVLGLTVYSQETSFKYEKESRINESEVPQTALAFLEQLGFDTKIKWYREQNLKQTSIEAKTKYKGQRYSIEFSEDGQIEDIEIIIDRSDIPESTWENIDKYLREKYEKHKLCKAQIQYTGTTEELIAKVIQDKPLPSSQIKYELIFKTKTSQEKRIREMLFDAEGQLERSDEVIFRNTDNLEY